MNILVIILVGTIALSLGISYPMMSLAQQEQSEELPAQIDVPMNLTLKLKDGGNEEGNEMCNSLGDLVKAPEENQSNGTSSDESSSSGNSTENKDEDN